MSEMTDEQWEQIAREIKYPSELEEALVRLLDAERARAQEAEEFLDAALNAEAKQTARADAAEAKLAAMTPTDPYQRSADA